MISHLHCHNNIYMSTQFTCTQAHTLIDRSSLPIIYYVFPVPKLSKQSISLQSLVNLLTLHRGHVLKVRTLSQSLDHKTQERIHLAFLAATDFLSGETFHTNKVIPELFVVVTKKHRQEGLSKCYGAACN